VALLVLVPQAGGAEGPRASPRPEGRPPASAAPTPIRATVAGSGRLLAPLGSPRPVRRPASEAAVPRRGGDVAAAVAAASTERSLDALAEQRRARALAMAATRPEGRLSSVSARTAAPARAQAAGGGGLLQRVFAPGPSRPGRGQMPGRSASRPGGLADVTGEAIAPIRGSRRGCGIAAPLRVRAVAGVALNPPATLDREAAAALAEWTRAVAIPAVGRRGGGLAELKVAAHYACRTRNSVPGARLSEHAAGRAIDISGFTLRDGTTLSVAEHYRRGRNAEVLRAAHRGACGPFATTLGPGSDGQHDDHLHFDLGRPGGSSYCH